ncbi:MAG: hypothetical protein KDC46_11735 [Thermoleophilia bacterium]|nr:hypothetical protein [Thermoleophilia bacterium]
MNRSRTYCAARGERAFGLVEVIVAGVVLMIVAAAISTVVVGTLKSQASLTRSERKTAVAEGLFERLKADNDWAGPNGANCNSMPMGQTTTPCKAAWLRSHYAADRIVDQSDSSSPITYDIRYKVVGVDDALDGVGQNDADGTRPDYYDAEIRVRRDSQDKWAVMRGTIDPPGRASTGALTINVCQVKRQWDERIPIASCPEDNEVLLGYPAGGLPPPFGSNTDKHAQYDWRAALSQAGSAGGAVGWKRVTYLVEPANGVQVRLTKRAEPGITDFTVYPAGWTPPGNCSGSAGRTAVTCTVTGANPLVTVPGLLPGHYDVKLVDSSIPHGYEPWSLQSIPSGDTAIVEGGRTSRALQVIKPVDRSSYTVDLWSCDESEVQTWGTGPCVDRIEPYGFSGYLAPAASARAHWSFDSSQSWLTGSGVESVGAGARSITFNGLAPGLYSGRVVTGSQGSYQLTRGPDGTPLEFMWIDPVAGGLAGGDDPNSGEATYTRHWCDYDRRVAYLAGVGLGSNGGYVPRTVYEYDSVLQEDGTYASVVTGSHIVQDYYYSADASCKSSGGTGTPPGPGSGGA